MSGGDRRGPGHGKGLFEPKSSSDKAANGVTGGFGVEDRVNDAGHRTAKRDGSEAKELMAGAAAR